jgi:hypothetical protein
MPANPRLGLSANLITSKLDTRHGSIPTSPPLGSAMAPVLDEHDDLPPPSVVSEPAHIQVNSSSSLSKNPVNRELDIKHSLPTSPTLPVLAFMQVSPL